MRRIKKIQITIFQAEIEDAIRKHVLDMVSVKAGMDVAIELRATRGETGATAIINITQGTATPQMNQVKNPMPEAPTQTNVAASTKRITTADLKRMQEEEAAQEATVEAAEGEAAEATADAPTDAPDEAKAAPATPTASENPAPTRKLFAGFTKPVNAAA